MLKNFIKAHKKLFVVIIVIIIILLPLSIYLLIKQPIFFDHKFNELPKSPSANETTLKKHVKFLSKNDRVSKEGQEKIVKYILNNLKENGVDDQNIEIQKYLVNDREYQNIIVHLKENKRENKTIPKYVIGGHYDSHGKLPGADDNASAIAGLLEISRVLNETKFYNGRDIDLVFYSTEELPFFKTENMGSVHHAKSIKNDTNIELVIVLEMIGYFSEEENSQNFPISSLKKLYPTKGNFIAIVSNFSNSKETKEVKNIFKSFLENNNIIGVESINAPTTVSGIDFSDHRSYWGFDIPAIMITDTAFYRNKNYHTKNDTYEKLDYKKMKEVVDATITTVLSL